MAAAHPDRRSKNRPTGSSLAEIHRRLVRIHYPLAEAMSVDETLHRRTLERLMDLINYVDASVDAENTVQS